MESADWIFAAVVSHDALHARLGGLARQQAIIGTGGLLLPAVALGFVARVITRPSRTPPEASPAENMFVTIFCGILDPSKVTIEFSNAGHNRHWFSKKSARIHAKPLLRRIPGTWKCGFISGGSRA